MAITSYLYQILISLKKKELISSGKTNSILEIGEQNWYGDVSFQDLEKTIDNYSDSKSWADNYRKWDTGPDYKTVT